MSDKLYFSTIRQEKNKPCDYEFVLPVFGESNTDQSFFEPNASRISNMRKSASGFSTGVYDFDKNPGKMIPDNSHVPFGRKLGLTMEEVSQLETRNNASIKSQADNTEKLNKELKESAKKRIEEAVEISKAISTSKESD